MSYWTDFGVTHQRTVLMYIPPLLCGREFGKDIDDLVVSERSSQEAHVDQRDDLNADFQIESDPVQDQISDGKSASDDDGDNNRHQSG